MTGRAVSPQKLRMEAQRQRLLEEIQTEREAVLGEAEPNADVPPVEDGLASRTTGVSDTASASYGGSTPSVSPNTDERTIMRCKICGADASDAPKAGSHAKLCAHHRQLRSAEMSAQRKGRPRGDVAARRSTRPQPEPTPAPLVTIEPEPVRNGYRTPLGRLLATIPAAQLDQAVDEYDAAIAQLQAELRIVEEARA